MNLNEEQTDWTLIIAICVPLIVVAYHKYLVIHFDSLVTVQKKVQRRT